MSYDFASGQTRSQTSKKSMLKRGEVDDIRRNLRENEKIIISTVREGKHLKLLQEGIKTPFWLERREGGF